MQGEIQSQKIECKRIVSVERNDRISKMIEEQKFQVQQNLKKQFQNFMKRLQKSGVQSVQIEESYQCLSQFLKACFNTMSVYFPLLSDKSFISLQSQKQIMDRLLETKNSIFRSFKSLCSKLILNPNQGEKIKQKVKEKKNKQPKGLNSKTPIQNTVVLTEWLLRNFNNPYPSNQQKQKLAEQSGLSTSKVNNWFVNSRERVIKKYTKNQVKELSAKQKKNSDKSFDSK